MSCCASKRLMMSSQSLPSRAPANGASVPGVAPVQASRPIFEHRGRGPLAVTGRASGARYVFAAAGARVAVDPRDVAQLARNAVLVRLR